jgi:hypothetical protein
MARRGAFRTGARLEIIDSATTHADSSLSTRRSTFTAALGLSTLTNAWGIGNSRIDRTIALAEISVETDSCEAVCYTFATYLSIAPRTTAKLVLIRERGGRTSIQPQISLTTPPRIATTLSCGTLTIRAGNRGF